MKNFISQICDYTAYILGYIDYNIYFTNNLTFLKCSKCFMDIWSVHKSKHNQNAKYVLVFWKLIYKYFYDIIMIQWEYKYSHKVM